MRLRGCFVTGTDTGVGKTRVSAALLWWLKQRGVQAAGLKPVAAGVSESPMFTPSPSRGGRGWGWAENAAKDAHPLQAHPHPNPPLEGEGIKHKPSLSTQISSNDDITLLLQASPIPLQRHDIGPCQLIEPCAPTIAAALESRSIDRAQLHQAAIALTARAEFLVIEGVGGFCVPLGADWDSADLAADYNLPVILVVGLRLGCINHALLSTQAIAQRGLTLAGWVGNTLDPTMPHIKDNLALLTHELQRRHQAPCLGLMPWSKNPAPETLATHFNHALLELLFKEHRS